MLNKIMAASTLKGVPYPDYFSKIQTKGYTHLYDHLVQMVSIPVQTDRTKAIKSLDYFKAASIVLETRKAVLDTVTTLSYNPRTVVFLLGGSGSGKSTSLCFLCEEDMIFKTGQYVSNGEGNRYIGHAQATSCTFFPNTAYLPERSLLLIDFPGFNDTNGELVALGMELALKHLIQRYQPKVLILESITNTEGRFANIKRLSQHMARILERPGDCTLGITKYRNDPNYKEIVQIETHQREQLLQASEKLIHDLETEIKTLNGVIPTLPEAFRGPLLEQVKVKKTALDDLNKLASVTSVKTLPDTDEKKKYKSKLSETEQTLQEQAGINRVVRFARLEDKAPVSDHLTALASSPSLTLNPALSLDTDSRLVLQHIFEHSLLHSLLSESSAMGDPNTFKLDVLRRSLIARLTHETHPEVGEFLHLLEMDGTLAKAYDQKIIKAYVEDNINILVKNSSLDLVPILLKSGFPITPSDEKALKDKVDEVKKFVCKLHGVSEQDLKSDPTLMDKKWGDMKKLYKKEDVKIGQSYDLKGYIWWLAVIPLGIPYGINELCRSVAVAKERKETLEKNEGVSTTNAKRIIQDLQDVMDAILTLKEVELLIVEHDNIERAFNNTPPLPGQTYETYRNQVEAVSEIVNRYSPTMFDRTVSDLHNQVSQEFEKLKDTPPLQEWLNRGASGRGMLFALKRLVFSVGYEALPDTLLGRTIGRISQIVDEIDAYKRSSSSPFYLHPGLNRVLTPTEVNHLKTTCSNLRKNADLFGLFMYLFCTDASMKIYDVDKLQPYIEPFMPVESDSGIGKGVVRAVLLKWLLELPPLPQ
jgi:hypothetical protein